MRYYSLNHLSTKVSFHEAMTISESSDGGLYMPERIPILPKALYNNMSLMSLRDITFIVFSSMFDGDMPAHVIKRIGDEAASYLMPLYEIEPGIYVIELFHGPTRTVKDFGAIALAHIFQELHSKNDEDLNVLVPTHGNSGGAIAQAFYGVPGVNIFVLYPKGTPKEYLDSITTLGENIHVIEVNGTIDDCKSMIHKAFSDRDLNMVLTSANSINLGSLLPSTIPFFHAYGQLMNRNRKAKDIYVSVPTGNCGNLLAGYIAKKMGLPIKHLIGACNENGCFKRYLESGERTYIKSIKNTLAYGMDTNQTVNLPRFDELCNGDLNQLRKDITAEISTDQEIAFTINDVYRRTGYLLDPHSATAYCALKKHLPKGASGIVFATSHPAKSMQILNKINEGGIKFPFKIIEKTYCSRPEAKIPATYGALRKYLKYYNEMHQNQSKFA